MSLGTPPPTHKQVAGIRQHLLTWGRDAGAENEGKVAGEAFRVVLAAFCMIWSLARSLRAAATVCQLPADLKRSVGSWFGKL